MNKALSEQKARLGVFAALFCAALGAGIFSASAAQIQPPDIHDLVRGKIILQVQQKGEAFYVFPGDDYRYYLDTPDNAYKIMRLLGTEVRHNVATAKVLPPGLAGRVIIDVDDHGKAYYIEPAHRTATYLAGPKQVFEVIHRLDTGRRRAS